jgi:hypothetical protein
VSKEPTRLIESDTGALGEELAALRGRLPSAERWDALAARLAATGAAGADSPAPTPLGLVDATPARTSKVLDPSAKLVLVALLAGGGLVAGAVWWRGPDKALEVRMPPVVTTPSTVPHRGSTIAVPTATPPATAAPVGIHAPAPEQSVARGATVPNGEADSSAAPAATSPGSLAQASPPLGSTRVPSAPLARAEREAGRTAPRSTARSGDEPSPSGPLAESTVVVSEVELLKQARSALSADPVQAFTLTERCRAQYPNGGFAQEREFIAISALVRMGRTDEARSRVSLFRMHYPSSAYLPRLTRMLGDE